MRLRYDNKGFSLVETLVVCVIVAVLAAVSIPLYNGYVTNQRWSTVNNLAETAAAAANAQWRRINADLPATSPVVPNTSPLNLYFNATNYTVEILAGGSIKVTDALRTSITKTLSYH
jgi:prepilin-type N-terminal cleavage/methylation domain-containing protein